MSVSDRGATSAPLLNKSKLQTVDTKVLPPGAISVETAIKIAHHNHSIPGAREAKLGEKKAAAAALKAETATCLASLLEADPNFVKNLAAQVRAGDFSFESSLLTQSQPQSQQSSSNDADEGEAVAAIESGADALAAPLVSAIPPCPDTDVQGPGLDTPGTWWLGSWNTQYLVLGKKLAILDNVSSTFHICAPNFNVESPNIQICAETVDHVGLLKLCGDFVSVVANRDIAISSARDIFMNASNNIGIACINDLSLSSFSGIATFNNFQGPVTIESVLDDVTLVANPTSFPGGAGNVYIWNKNTTTGDIELLTLAGDINAQSAGDVFIESVGVANEVRLKAPNVYVETPHFHVTPDAATIHMKGGTLKEPAYAEYYAVEADNASPFVTDTKFKFPKASIAPQNISANGTFDIFTLDLAGFYEISWGIHTNGTAVGNGGQIVQIFVESGTVAGDFAPPTSDIVGPAAVARTAMCGGMGATLNNPGQSAGRCVIRTITAAAQISVRNGGGNFAITSGAIVRNRLIIRRIDFEFGQ